MNEFIEITLANDETVGFSVEWNGSGYTYLQNINNKVTTIGTNTNKPTELSTRTDVGTVIKNYLKQVSLPEGILEDDIKQFRGDQYKDFMKQLNGILQKEYAEKQKKKATEIKQKENYYKNLYQQYISRRDSYNYSDLEFIGQISLGLGVGLGNTILKMFINHLLTITKIKPSNQIVYSKQASGKSFIIDQTLKMIPAEFVLNGRTTPAFFYNEYDGQDVSGRIFYFGDLGGSKDNENTIEVRDLVKILNTDGIVERGITGPDGTPTKQTITGKPSLTYSTVDSEIINSQEKSRGSVFSPPLIDDYQLTAYNSVMSSPGVFKSTLDTIASDVESVKGLVWSIKDKLSGYELFNPYLFNVTNFLNRMDDFNRKINEFNTILLIVTYLNNPFILEHELYDKKLMIASKQDVVNALALFEGKDNLLPNYRLCIQNIAKIFELDETNADYFKDADKYNEHMTNELPDGVGCKNSFKPDLLTWDDINEGDSKVWFTISILRKKFRKMRWFSRVKDNLSEVLRSLYEYGYLLKNEKGKINGENVYCLPYDIDFKLSNITPVWGGDDLSKSMDLFKLNYPDLFVEFETFIKKDCQINVKLSNLELNHCSIYDLVWEQFNNYSKSKNDYFSDDDDSEDFQATEPFGGATETNPDATETNWGASEPDWGATETVNWYEEASF